MKKLNFTSVLQFIALICFIYGLVTGNAEISLACGIFGIINTKKNLPFDYSTYCILGIANDLRGGDSCGVFIDGNYDWGAYQEKYFADYLYTSKVLKDAKNQEVSVAIGHCRKASPGMGPLDKEHAQPVVITDKDGKVKFVMVHNGTIYNYEELAKKYIPQVDIKGLTDSQVMARIFYYSGYQALSEYYGGSVFFIVDYRQKDHPAFIFQGQSKEHSYDTEVKLERPFYFTQSKDGAFKFSSIQLHLDVMFPDDTTYIIQPNTLCKLTARGLHIVKQYPRDKVMQTRPVTTTTYSSYPYYSGAATTQAAKTTKATNNWLTDERGIITTSKTEIKTTSTTGSSSTSGYMDSIRHKNGLYYEMKTDKLLHDRIYLSDWGGLYGSLNSSINGLKIQEMYFFYGIPLDLAFGKKYFSYLDRIQKNSGLSPDEFVKLYQNQIRYLSADRVYHSEKLNSFVEAVNLKDSALFTGDKHTIGCNSSESVENGVVISEKSSYTSYDTFFITAKKLSPVDHVPYKTIKLACLKME